MATADELVAALPGDGLLDRVDVQRTRAITIRARPEDVWPWVVQLGQERGGFYSYDRLENLFGCRVHSADEIVAEWQSPAVGDPFKLHPKVALEIAEVDPPRAMVIAGVAPAPSGSGPEDADADADAADDADPSRRADATPAPPYDFTWAFVVADIGPGQTRLMVRERYRYRPGARGVRPMVAVLARISALMTQRMLRGIRARAERCSSDPLGA